MCACGLFWRLEAGGLKIPTLCYAKDGAPEKLKPGPHTQPRFCISASNRELRYSHSYSLINILGL
jgi:hypothetical protein